MNIKTTFEIDQEIWLARVERKMETLTCPACGGVGKIEATAEDGIKYQVDCPNIYYKTRVPEEKRCHGGKINVRMRPVALLPQILTVGMIKVEIGGLSKSDRTFDNLGYKENQNFERKEQVMCYETGIGSGSLYYVEPQKWGGIFATYDEAVAWADAEAKRQDEEDV